MSLTCPQCGTALELQARLADPASRFRAAQARKDGAPAAPPAPESSADPRAGLQVVLPPAKGKRETERDRRRAALPLGRKGAVTGAAFAARAGLRESVAQQWLLYAARTGLVERERAADGAWRYWRDA